MSINAWIEGTVVTFDAAPKPDVITKDGRHFIWTAFRDGVDYYRIPPEQTGWDGPLPWWVCLAIAIAVTFAWWLA